MNVPRALVGSLVIVLVLAACGTQGPPGPEGPQGPEGPLGPEGPKGPEGNANVVSLTIPGTDVTWEAGSYLGRPSNVFTLATDLVDADVVAGGAVLGFVRLFGAWHPLPFTWENNTGTDRQHITFTYVVGSIRLYAYRTSGVLTPALATDYRFFVIREPEALAAAAASGEIDLADHDAVVRHFGVPF